MVSAIFISTVFALSCNAYSTSELSEYVNIPGGYKIHPSCINQVPHGLLLDDSLALPECKYPLKSRVSESPFTEKVGSGLQIYAADVHQQMSNATVPGFTYFTADFVVPPLPASGAGQVVYFWPGFKSKKPEMGLPVLQPVLQYGQSGPTWELQSWFVDASQPQYPVATGPAIAVKPGDELTTFMKLDAEKDTWTVFGLDKTSGESSTLTISVKRAGNCNYDWAMLVNENINVDNICKRMPKTSAGMVFSNITVDNAVGWTTRANCASDPDCNCGNNATVDAATGDVTLMWHN